MRKFLRSASEPAKCRVKLLALVARILMSEGINNEDFDQEGDDSSENREQLIEEGGE